jgi:hypothetical protein
MPPSTQKKTGPTPRRTTRRDAAPETIAQPSDPQSKYAPTSWGNGGAGSMVDLTVPSGQTCLVRRPGVEGLIKTGVLKNVDSLTAIVNEKHIKRVEGRETLDVKSLDEAALETIMDTIDKIIAFAVVQPPVFRTPDDVTNRVPGTVYTDMIDTMDKMFIFNFVVGGTRDLESFRSEFFELLGSVATGEDVPVEAK